MTENEYKEEVAKIEATYKNAISVLGFEYAKSKREFNFGDIIKDINADITIKIDKMGTGKLNGLPYPIYMGIILTKKLEPKKNGDRHAIHASVPENIQCLIPLSNKRNQL